MIRVDGFGNHKCSLLAKVQLAVWSLESHRKVQWLRHVCMHAGVQKSAPQEPAPEAEAASAVQNFAELVDGLSMRQQQRVLREAAMRANQGLPMPSRALLLAAESERLAEDGDVVEPPAAGSPRYASLHAILHHMLVVNHRERLSSLCSCIVLST